MTARISVLFGLVCSVALMLAALWVWQNASALTYTSDKPDIAQWAARSVAVAMGAAAQLLIAVLVVMRIYRRDVISNLYGFLAAIVLLMSIAGAVVLAVAGR